jgi:uncharacterized protein YjdB
VITTNEAGAVTITAEVNGSTAAADVQVVKSPVASVTVSPTNSSILPGEKKQLTATVVDAAGRTTSSGTAKWSSSDLQVAQVSVDGLVTGLKKGLAIITVQVQGKKATATVNVLEVPAATVTVSLAAGSLSVGQTTQATAAVLDAQGNVLAGRVVAWQSSNPALATVNASGLVTAIAKGSVTISAICDATVGNAALAIVSPTPTSITIVPTTVSLKPGQSTQLSAEVRDAAGTVIPNQVITWASANNAVAAVTTSGGVTAMAVGSTSAQASSDGLTASAVVAVTAVTAASIDLTPTNLSLVVGDSAKLLAVVRDASGAVLADRAVSWSSSNPAIAAVSSSGWVTAVGVGSGTVNAQVDGVTAATSVTVTPPPPAPVATIVVTLTSTSLTVGQTTQATAVLRDTAGNVLIGRAVSWSSANTGVATVSASGTVTALSAGSASIVATSEGQSGATTLTVVAPPPAAVATVSLSASSPSLVVGATMQINVTLKDASGNVLTGRTIGWTSSNTTVATVSPTGVVKALAAGTVTVTATSEGQSGSLALTVTPVPVATVKVTLSATSLTVGQTAQAQATLLDTAGNVLTGRSVTWTSSAPGVASVSGAGLVTAVAAGTANIVATSEGKSAGAAVTVTAGTSGASCSLVTDWTVRSQPALAKPGYLQPITEPTFGTRLIRISGDPGTAIGSGVSGTWPSAAARHQYSKVQAWSADGKLLALTEMSGAVGPGGQLYLDGETYQPLFARSHPGPEARWHPTLPDIMIYVASNGSIGHWNARTNTSTLKFTTTAYSNAYMGNYEGNPSFDGRYVLVNATRNSDGRAVVYVVDIQAGTKTGDTDVLAQGFATAADLDFAGVSASGNYFMLWGKINGVAQAAKVFTRDGALVQTWTDFRVGHLDMGYDAAGNDVMFTAAASGTNAKKFLSRRLDNGAVTLVSPAISYDWHASTKNYGRRGWGYGDTGDRMGTALDGQVYALKLDGSMTVERLAFHRSTSSSYNAQPQASVSPDGRRVIFASDWGVAGGPVQAYIVDTRPLCPNGLP